MSSPPEFVLHIWPGKWGLPSIDSSCLAALLHLQLTIPGRFAIAECNNPDLSPDGRLPFLTHDYRLVSPLSSIIKYIAGIGSAPKGSVDLDAPLSSVEKATRRAWYAHVEANLGDLLAYSTYSLRDNYAQVIHPTIVSFLPRPQCYYVPSRLRASYRARLQAAGLGEVYADEEHEDENFPRKRMFAFGLRREPEIDTKVMGKRAFARRRVLEKARSLFKLYTRLLSDKEFFYHDRPTPLDVLFAAHVLLLVKPPLPDTLVSGVLADEHAPLVVHAWRVYGRAFPDAADSVPAAIPKVAAATGYTLRSLLPQLRDSSAQSQSQPQSQSQSQSQPQPQPQGATGRPRGPRKKSPDDVRFDRMRWGFFAVMIGAVGWFVWTSGVVPRIVFVPEAEPEENYEGGEGREEEVVDDQHEDEEELELDAEVEEETEVKETAPGPQ